MALIVVLLATTIGGPFKVPSVSLGVLPSVVYRIEAPGVALLRLTLCAELYVPPPGLKAGAATTAPLAGASKNNPDRTALGPPVLVTRRITCPLTFHTRYCPF